MTDEELARLQALADAATKGPWHEVDPDNNTLFWIQTEPGIRVAKVWQWDDGMFIAASREAVPALIAEVRRLRKTLSYIADTGLWAEYRGEKAGAGMAAYAQAALEE